MVLDLLDWVIVIYSERSISDSTGSLSCPHKSFTASVEHLPQWRENHNIVGTVAEEPWLVCVEQAPYYLEHYMQNWDLLASFF